MEFVSCPLKKAAPQTPVHGVPKMRTLTLPTLGPQTLNKRRKCELRKVFTGEELVVAGNMAYDRMSCGCEDEYQDLFEIVPIVEGNWTSEKSYKNTVGQMVSIHRVSTRMKLGDEIEDGWKTSEESVVRGDAVIPGAAFRQFKFPPDAFFNIADGARAMRKFAHDAIPPVEGTARRVRERDKFSVGFDSACVRAAMARGRQ